jgi:hypothetical protein
MHALRGNFSHGTGAGNGMKVATIAIDLKLVARSKKMLLKTVASF